MKVNGNRGRGQQGKRGFAGKAVPEQNRGQDDGKDNREKRRQQGFQQGEGQHVGGNREDLPQIIGQDKSRRLVKQRPQRPTENQKRRQGKNEQGFVSGGQAAFEKVGDGFEHNNQNLRDFSLRAAKLYQSGIRAVGYNCGASIIRFFRFTGKSFKH